MQDAESTRDLFPIGAFEGNKALFEITTWVTVTLAQLFLVYCTCRRFYQCSQVLSLGLVAG